MLLDVQVPSPQSRSRRSSLAPRPHSVSTLAVRRRQCCQIRLIYNLQVTRHGAAHICAALHGRTSVFGQVTHPSVHAPRQARAIRLDLGRHRICSCACAWPSHEYAESFPQHAGEKSVCFLHDIVDANDDRRRWFTNTDTHRRGPDGPWNSIRWDWRSQRRQWSPTLGQLSTAPARRCVGLAVLAASWVRTQHSQGAKK